jgi:glycine/D-amino acid oxidase-like deaminating enzyme
LTGKQVDRQDRRGVAKLRVDRSLWLDASANHAWPRFPALRGDVEVDVAVVGGGVTGACVAWQFAEAGIRVALVEKARVARGSTAASTALLMQEPDKDFEELAARFGKRKARRIWNLSRAATREFVRALQRLAIRCDLEKCDSVYYTLDADRAAGLQAEYRRRRNAGVIAHGAHGGRWLDAAALRRTTGIRGAGAIRTSENAQVDPCKACIGLLRAAVDRGALVFERSGVRRIDRDAAGVVVRTSGGRVRAREVVIATGYATNEFRPLAGRFRMMRTYVMATERVGAGTARSMAPGNVMLWDTERPYHYARWTRDRRLLLGGADRPHATGGSRRRALVGGEAALRDYFERLYPALEKVRSAYAWEGLFATTSDGLPYIGRHRRYPNHLFALGYGGNGMTFGFLAAKLLLEQYQGRVSADHELFAFSRTRR